MKRLLTSESVTEGHPDKICDQISDAILDHILDQDPQARVACETTANTGLIYVMGEITTKASYNIESLVRKTLKEIGYTDSSMGFDYKTCSVISSINKQSEDIALGVDSSYENKLSKEDGYNKIGAGDQGIVFGYASKESKNYMPLPIDLAHRLAERLALVRKEGIIDYLRPDGKTQITVEYEDNKAKRIDTILVSSQHMDGVAQEKIKKDILTHVIKPIIPTKYIDEETKYLVNPTGRFVVGGPMGDTGLTGRKIIVDSYGGFSKHGGGAFSGKDATKVDRSASYMARYIAKNMVAAGLADEFEIGISYAIGVAHPVSVYVDSFSTGKLADEKLLEIVKENFDMRPAAIIDSLDLTKPRYRKTAAYGHFGREDENFSWEKLDRVDSLSRYLHK